MDISALSHLQTPLDAIRRSTATALGRTSKTNSAKTNPAETRQLFQAIDQQAALLNELIENMIDHAKAQADEQPDEQADEQKSDEELEPFVLDELTINYAARRVTVAGCPVRLTATEYRLLWELSKNAGQLFTHARLLRRVWGLGCTDDPSLLRTSIRRLRNKLGDNARSPTYIFTEQQVGYWMASA